MMINMLKRFGRSRQLHTIISKELIKPSSPTPSHLKTYTLSPIDIINPHQHLQFIFFYKNYNDNGINTIKKSLAQCLTHYYPFAGRLVTPSSNHVDCNDEGVEFLEASHDRRLDDFIVGEEKDDIVHELVPNFGKAIPDAIQLQLNHFAGGGAAMTVSISHRVGDGVTILTFLKQWVKVIQGGSPIKPYYVSSPTSDNNNVKQTEIEENAPQFESSYTNFNNAELGDTNINEGKRVTRRFMFPNAKLNDLKKKVMSMGIDLTSHPLTRVEVLTSLIYKHAVDASTTRSGTFNPSSLVHAVNMRNKIFKNDPEKVFGNIISLVHETSTDPREIALTEVVAKLRKRKMEIGETDIEGIAQQWVKLFTMLGGNPNLQPYLTSSTCGFPIYEVDFGWGKPIHVKFEIPHENNKVLLLLDAPNREGIIATLRLPEEDMNIFQQDKELLEYVEA